jgi:DNA replication protein DnaC
MNLIELNRALRQLRLGGIAAVLEMRLHQAQVESMAPIDLISCLVSDELTRRGDRLLERRRKQAKFRDPQKTLDNFDFTFNPKMNRSLVFDLATAAFIARNEDSLFVGPPGSGKSHLAQAIGLAAIQQGYRVLYRETPHTARGTGRSLHRRYPKTAHRVSGHGTLAHHRRLGHAQVIPHRRRGTPGNHHATL